MARKSNNTALNYLADAVTFSEGVSKVRVDAAISVDSMTINAEMSEATGQDYYVTTTNLGDGVLTIGFDTATANVVSGTLALQDIIKVENKTQGWIYITKGATVGNTSILLVAANQASGYPLPGAADEFEVVYRGKDRLSDLGTAIMTGSSPVTIATDDTMTAAGNASLVSIDTDTTTIAGDTTSLDAKQPALGTAIMTGSSPVTLATDDAAVVSLQLIDNSTAVDDSAQAATPAMLNVGGEYRATPTNYTDGDATILQTNVNGGLRIAGSIDHDVAIGSTNDLVMAGAEAASYDGAALPNAVAEGDAVRPKASLQGVQFVTVVSPDGSSKPAYDSGTDSNKSFEVNPVSDHYSTATLVENATETDATTYYYVDMNGYKNFSAQLEVTAGSGSMTVTLEATNQDDGIAAASCTYQDVTSALFSVASATTDSFWVSDTPTAFKYLRYKTVSSTGGANDAGITIYHKKMY
jgi:hypothetical protein